MEKRLTYADLLASFGHPTPPRKVTQEPFDGDQEALERLARSDENNIQVYDLNEYALDLRYQELQPDLLKYVFPLCLKVWRNALENGEAVPFVQQFHASIAATTQWKTLLDSRAREAVFRFMREGLLDAIESQRGLRFKGQMETGSQVPPSERWIDPVLFPNDPRAPGHAPYRWTSFLASFGTISDQVPQLWSEWWAFHTPGSAVAAIQYASCLIYPVRENPVFFRWTPNRGGGPPCLWSYESMGFEERWLPANVEFLKTTLHLEYLRGKLEQSVARLIGELEYDQARSVLEDLNGREATVRERLAILPERLATPSAIGGFEW